MSELNYETKATMILGCFLFILVSTGILGSLKIIPFWIFYIPSGILYILILIAIFIP